MSFSFPYNAQDMEGKNQGTPMDSWSFDPAIQVVHQTAFETYARHVETGQEYYSLPTLQRLTMPANPRDTGVFCYTGTMGFCAQAMGLHPTWFNTAEWMSMMYRPRCAMVVSGPLGPDLVYPRQEPLFAMLTKAKLEPLISVQPCPPSMRLFTMESREEGEAPSYKTPPSSELNEGRKVPSELNEGSITSEEYKEAEKALDAMFEAELGSLSSEEEEETGTFAEFIPALGIDRVAVMSVNGPSISSPPPHVVVQVHEEEKKSGGGGGVSLPTAAATAAPPQEHGEPVRISVRAAYEQKPLGKRQHKVYDKYL